MARVYPVLLTTLAACAMPAAANAAGFTQPLRATSAAPTAQAVGLLPNGTAGLATVQNVGGVPHVFVQVRPAGGTWSAPQDLGATGFASAGPPVITTAGNRLVLAYDKRDGTDQVALATLAVDASTWSDLGVVASGTLARVAGATDGSFTLAYRTIGGGLAVRRATSPTALGSTETLTGASNVTSLDVRRRSGGQLVAAWSEAATSGSTTTLSVEAARAEAGAPFTAPVPLDTGSSTTPGPTLAFSDVRVAVTAQDATVAWGTQTFFSATLSGRVEALSLPVTGSPGATQVLSSDSYPTGLSALTDDAGAVTVVFESGSIASGAVYAAVRPAGSTAFPSVPAQSIAASGNGQAPPTAPALAVSGSEALIAYGIGDRSFVVRRVGTALQPATALESGSGGPTAVAGDGAGQFAVAYGRSDAGSVGAWSRFFDRTPPTLSAVSASPSSAPVGSPIAFGTTVSDSLSSTPPLTWAFGDGGTGTGPSVSHAYGQAGQFTATARAVDEAGNEATVSSPVSITAPATGQPPVAEPPVVGPPVVVPPVVKPKKVTVSALKLTRTGLRLKLSASAKVTAAAQRQTCRTVKRKRRCVYGKAKKVTVSIGAGTRTVKLKVGRGTYRVTVSAVTTAGTTKRVVVLKRK